MNFDTSSPTPENKADEDTRAYRFGHGRRATRIERSIMLFVVSRAVHGLRTRSFACIDLERL